MNSPLAAVWDWSHVAQQLHSVAALRGTASPGLQRVLLQPAFEGHLRGMAGSCGLLEKLLGAVRRVKEQWPTEWARWPGGQVVGQAVDGQEVQAGAAAVPGPEACVEDEVGKLVQWLGQWGQQQQASVWQGLLRAVRLCMLLQAAWRDCLRLLRAEQQGVRAREVCARCVYGGVAVALVLRRACGV